MAEPDEVGTPPDYEKGVGPQDLPVVIQGTGTRLIHPRPRKTIGQPE